MGRGWGTRRRTRGKERGRSQPLRPPASPCSPGGCSAPRGPHPSRPRHFGDRFGAKLPPCYRGAGQTRALGRPSRSVLWGNTPCGQTSWPPGSARKAGSPWWSGLGSPQHRGRLRRLRACAALQGSVDRAPHCPAPKGDRGNAGLRLRPTERLTSRLTKGLGKWSRGVRGL